MKKRVAGHSISLGVLLTSVMALPVLAGDPTLPYQYSEEWSIVSAPGPAGPYQPVNIDPRVPGSALPTLPQIPPMLESGGPPPMAGSWPEAGGPVTDIDASVTTVDETNLDIAEPESATVESAVGVADTATDTAEAVAGTAEVAAETATPAAGATGAAAETVEPVAESAGSVSEIAVPEATTLATPEPDRDIYAETLGYPPAAGRIEESPAYDSPSGPAAAAAGVRPPAGYGYYQQMVPRGPAYGYPGAGGYQGQGWSQGYRNTPPAGYYRSPARTVTREPEVPPPPVYEEMQNRRPR